MTSPTTPTDTDLAEMAGKLSKAQRAGLLSAVEKDDGALRSPRWICSDADRVRGPLLAAGLVYLAVPMFAWRSSRRDIVLTPLGLALRNYLLRTTKETNSGK